jgi:hypothetical protein
MTENHARYDRKYLRYPSDLTDAEWAPAKPGGNKRTVNRARLLTVQRTS